VKNFQINRRRRIRNIAAEKRHRILLKLSLPGRDPAGVDFELLGQAGQRLFPRFAVKATFPPNVGL
jgi:hypothetical protein